MKPITWLLLFGLSSGLYADAARNAAELANFRAVAFGNVRSVSVAKILDPKKHEMAEPPKNLFHGFALVSDWQTVDPDSRLRLAGILREPIRARLKAYESAGDADVAELSSFCLPDPGYAIHLETDEGPRDFVICLECDDLTAYGKSQSRAHFSIENEPLATLKKYYQKEFHD
jgi:hypothetical protein